MNAGEKKALTETLSKGKTALVASQASFAGASIFLGKALEKLWKSLSVLQMLNHLALMNIPLPPNYLTYMESMNEMNTKNLYAARPITFSRGESPKKRWKAHTIPSSKWWVTKDWIRFDRTWSDTHPEFACVNRNQHGSSLCNSCYS